MGEVTLISFRETEAAEEVESGIIAKGARGIAVRANPTQVD